MADLPVTRQQWSVDIPKDVLRLWMDAKIHEVRARIESTLRLIADQQGTLQMLRLELEKLEGDRDSIEIGGTDG